MIAASAVYAAFRRDGESRTLDKVSTEADMDRRRSLSVVVYLFRLRV